MPKRPPKTAKRPSDDAKVWSDPMLEVFDLDAYTFHAPPDSRLLRDKQRLIKAYIITRGVGTRACILAGLPVARFHNYMASDVEFKRAVDDVRLLVNDWAEGQLLDLVDAHSERSVHFYLKSRHKEYADRLRLADSTGGNLVIRWADEPEQTEEGLK